MRSSPSARFRFSILLVSALACANIASAQFSKLDDLATQLTKELKPFKPHLVAVVDFRPPDPSAALQGHYFAWMLSDTLQNRGKKQFTVADHTAFDTDLSKLNISANSLVPGATLKSAAPHLGADVLITGTLEKRDDSYLLQVTPIRVVDGKSLKHLQLIIPPTEFLDSLITPFPEGIHRANPGRDGPGMTVPSCIYCPNPSYTELARKNKFQGTAILEVLISADGLPMQIRPLRFLGQGLDESAFETLKKWQFKPATLKENGTPVPIIVPVEVSFRLY